MENRSDYDDTTSYDTSFKVLDAYDYSSISTIDAKRSLFDLSVNGNGSLIALVEDQPSYEAKPETFVKIYCVGMKKTEQDEEVCDEEVDQSTQSGSSHRNLSRLHESFGAGGGMGRDGAIFATTAASGNGGVGGHAAPRPRAAGGVYDVGVGGGGGGGGASGGGGNGGGAGGGAVGNGNNVVENANHGFGIRWNRNNIEIIPPHLMGHSLRRHPYQLQPQPQPRSHNHHHHHPFPHSQQNRTVNNHNPSNNSNSNRDAGPRAAPAAEPHANNGGGGGGRSAAAAANNANNGLNDDSFDLDDIAINLLSLLVGR